MHKWAWLCPHSFIYKGSWQLLGALSWGWLWGCSAGEACAVRVQCLPGEVRTGRGSSAGDALSARQPAPGLPRAGCPTASFLGRPRGKALRPVAGWARGTPFSTLCIRGHQTQEQRPPLLCDHGTFPRGLGASRCARELRSAAALPPLSLVRGVDSHLGHLEHLHHLLLPGSWGPLTGEYRPEGSARSFPGVLAGPRVTPPLSSLHPLSEAEAVCAWLCPQHPEQPWSVVGDSVKVWGETSDLIGELKASAGGGR